MSRYLLLYRAPVGAAEQMAANDPEAAKAGMDAWLAWGEKAGSALADMGAPLQPVAGGGGDGDPVTGYAIMEADTLEALQELLADHPHTASGGSIDLLEFLPMPGMEGGSDD